MGEQDVALLDQRFILEKYKNEPYQKIITFCKTLLVAKSRFAFLPGLCGSHGSDDPAPHPARNRSGDQRQ